jgi:hypothetical protein
MPVPQEAVTTGGKNFGNPLWNLTTLIATMTKEPSRCARHVPVSCYYNKEILMPYLKRKRERKEKGIDGLLAVRSQTTVIGMHSCVHFAASICSMLPQVSLRKRAMLRQMRPKVLQQLADTLTTTSLWDTLDEQMASFAKSLSMKTVLRQKPPYAITPYLIPQSKSTQSVS